MASITRLGNRVYWRAGKTYGERLVGAHIEEHYEYTICTPDGCEYGLRIPYTEITVLECPVATQR